MKIAQALAHLFIPRESNNQKAKLLHPSSLTSLTFLLIIFQIVLSFAPKFGTKVLGYAANIAPSEVIRLTNEKRIAVGVSPLSENSVLSQAAQAKGTDMLNKGYWAHVSPDGVQPWKFFTDFGYEYKYAGENLARDFSDPVSAVEAWMASPSHRENLLSPKYKEIGIAVVEGPLSGADTTIIVQFFGTKYADTLPAAPIAKAQTIPTSTLTPASLIPTPQPGYLGETSLAKPQQFTFSPFNTTKGVSLAIVAILLVVLILDGVIVYLRKIPRISGRNLAHLSFLGMILVVVLILKAGEII